MTFEELKREAQKATGRDRLGATACSLIAEILNTQAQIDETRAALMMATEISGQRIEALHRVIQFSLLINIAWVVALILIKVST